MSRVENAGPYNAGPENGGPTFRIANEINDHFMGS